MVEILVDGQALELDDLTKIKYTAQISDIFDIAKVKASHTNSFSVPKTYNNVRIFQGLGLMGSESNIPYEKIPATIKENGFDVVRNGWLNVVETSDKYKINIIDGAIDFFKEIENINIGDLDLSEINHTKTLESVINSFTNEYYRYIIGDYNGKNLAGEDFQDFNIDYQVPSARYKYLIEKIFQSFGWSFDGSIFSNEDYLNYWVTFPKATFSEDTEPTLIAKLNKGDFIDTSPILKSPNTYKFVGVESWDSSNIDEGSLINNWKFVAPEANQYFINIKSRGYFRRKASNINLILNVPFQISVLKNGELLGQPLNVFNTDDFYHTTYFGMLQSGDVIDFEYTGNATLSLGQTPISLNLQFTEVNISRSPNANISFTDEFKDFKITDFFNDFLRRFGLTMVADNDSRTLHFYTLQERLNRSNTIDWSRKFVRRTKEVYVTGSYAQNNYFKQKYNSENQDFSDGVLVINNKNLPNEKTIYTSPFYSRTNIISDFLASNFTYPIWEKEPKENDGQVEISYKGLSGRWYMIKDKPIVNTIKLTSELTGSSEIVNEYPVLDGHNTHYSDLTPIYYNGYQTLLNSYKIHEMEFVITELDRINLDFTKPIYVEAEGSYYLLNKVTFETDKPSKVEAIKINFDIETTNYENILSYSDGCFNITNFEPGKFFFQFSYDDGANWAIGSIAIMENPSCGFSTLNPVLFRLVDGTGSVVSNTIQINP